MAAAFKLCFVILSCTAFVQADVAQQAYRRYSRQRAQPLRLQRLESSPTPYPAAGYRPNREFSLPSDQPLFPLGGQQSNDRLPVTSGFDHLSEPQKPQFIYGSPQPEPRFSQPSRPQNSPGFDHLAGVETDFNNFAESQQPQNINNDFNDGFNSLPAEQQPDLLYGAPNNQEPESQNGFDDFSEPQYNYNAPSARLQQQLVNRLQRAQRVRQSYTQAQSQQFHNAPQTLYAGPSHQRAQVRNRLMARKPARLTDKREETEEEADAGAAETVEDIETTTAKDEGKKTINQPAAMTPVVSYYPATAFGFVQPVSGATSYPTVQPVSAAYTVGSPFLPQQYTLAVGAPAQLQPW